MIDLRNVPSQHDRSAWPDFLSEVETLATKPEVTLSEIGLCGELFNRLRPIGDSWSHQLQRLADDRLRHVSLARDRELEALHQRLSDVIGQLRQFAAITNSGNAEFPTTLAHLRFAAEVMAADSKAKAQVKAAEEAAQARPEWRWTARGWVRQDEA